MQVLQRRYEKQQVEADEYTKDWIACFELISKIIHVEEARNDDDTKDKLIAVGNEQDISHALKFLKQSLSYCTYPFYVTMPNSSLTCRMNCVRRLLLKSAPANLVVL